MIATVCSTACLGGMLPDSQLGCQSSFMLQLLCTQGLLCRARCTAQ